MCTKAEFSIALNSKIQASNDKKQNELLGLLKRIVLKSNIKKSDKVICKEYNYSDSGYFKYNLSFCDIDKYKREALQNFDLQGILLRKGYKINIELNERISVDRSKYLSIVFSKYKNIYFDEKGTYLSSIEKNVSIIINEDLSIYTNQIKSKLLPLTFSTLSSILSSFKVDFIDNLFFDIIKIILNFTSKDNIFAKEIFNEYIKEQFYIPVKIVDIYKCHNKKELINLYFKNDSIPKCVNKFLLSKGYILMKCKKYVKNNEFQKLYILKDLEFTQWSWTVKESVIEFFTLYYEKALELKEYDEYYEDKLYIIKDYVRMKLQSSDKILNLKIKSYKRICEEHDNISIKLRQKETKIIKIPKNSKFKNLKLGNEFEEIKTKKRIVEESVKQDNCVWMYADYINKDKCRIFSTMFEDKRYTLEIRKRRNKFVLVQIEGKYHSKAPNQLITNIKNILKNIVC